MDRTSRSDGSEFAPAAVLGAVVLLTRLPFIGGGPGVDADADRIVLAARSIASGAGYTVSRLPGNPVVEIAGAALVRAGAGNLNLASAVLSAVSAAIVLVLLRTAGVRFAWAGALAFAAAPIVFIHSTTSMDYLWALTFLLAALLAARRGRPVAAGVLLGFATGCRITTIGLLPAVALAIPARAGRSRLSAAIQLSGVAPATALLVFLPVLNRYGGGFLAHSNAVVPWSRLVYKSTVLVWGWPGLIALGVAALALALAAGLARGDSRSRGSLPGRIAMRLRDEPLVGAALAGATLIAILFLRLPLEAGYLIPFVPFALLLAGLLLPPRGFAAVCIAIGLSPLVTLSVPGAPAKPSSVALGSASVRPAPGPIFQDAAARGELQRQVAGMLAFANARSSPALVLVGAKQLPRLKRTLSDPRLELDPTGTPAANRTTLLVGQVRFVSRLDADALQSADREGREVFYVDDVARENLTEAGLDPRLTSAHPLEPDGSAP